MLRLTERQAWRLLRRFRQDGAPGLVSRKRGRPSNRRHHPALHKQVNDKLGHAPGDELLRTVVKRRQNSLRSGDVSARLAGEEFAVLLRDSVSAWIVETISQRIIATISAPFRLERQEITIGTSIGIFMARDRMLTRDQIMQGADKALY
jgi:diguanylate cyclase (GGDEF)-like protein